MRPFDEAGGTEGAVRFYLGEEPRLRSVRTLDPGHAECLEEILDRAEEPVIKPRAGHGGVGVVVCPHASSEGVELARAAVRAAPERHIAQEMVLLSEHPALVDGTMAPRHVDPRPFVFLGPGREARVLPEA